MEERFLGKYQGMACIVHLRKLLFNIIRREFFSLNIYLLYKQQYIWNLIASTNKIHGILETFMLLFRFVHDFILFLVRLQRNLKSFTKNIFSCAGHFMTFLQKLAFHMKLLLKIAWISDIEHGKLNEIHKLLKILNMKKMVISLTRKWILNMIFKNGKFSLASFN